VGLENNFNFLSNGGGATLEFLAGVKLPGLEVLDWSFYFWKAHGLLYNGVIF